MTRTDREGELQGGGQGGRESSLPASLPDLPALNSDNTDQGGETKIRAGTPKPQENDVRSGAGRPPSLPVGDSQTERHVSRYVTRTARAREHLFALYRSGQATDAELQQAHRAYDEAAEAEGVQAVVDAVGALTDEQRHILAVLLAPNAAWNSAVPRPRKPID